MKKVILLFLLIFAISETYAQNYQISFAGTGSSAIVDSVKVENLTQCIDTIINGSDILNLTASLGVNEINNDEENALHIFANPNSGTCLFDFKTISQGQATIELYSITGKRIFQVKEILSKGHNTFSLSGICSGVYLLKIESDKYSCTERIVSSNTSSDIAQIRRIGATISTDKQITFSNTEKTIHFKNEKSLLNMQYNSGDILKLTGFSEGHYRTIFMFVPSDDTTVTFMFLACTDADNNDYSVVKINTKIWMAENLRTIKYNNGDTIPKVDNDLAWSSLTIGAFNWYNNDSSTYAPSYGALYNWFAVQTGNLCPSGWHVPDDAEWSELTTSLGGEFVAGGKLKESCSGIFECSSLNFINESGWTGLPGGIRDSIGMFEFFGFDGFWWSSTEIDSDHSWSRYLWCGNNSIFRKEDIKASGFSVRCIKD